MSRGKGTQECLDVIKEYVAVDKINFIQVNLQILVCTVTSSLLNTLPWVYYCVPWYALVGQQACHRSRRAL